MKRLIPILLGFLPVVLALFITVDTYWGAGKEASWAGDVITLGGLIDGWLIVGILVVLAVVIIGSLGRTLN